MKSLVILVAFSVAAVSFGAETKSKTSKIKRDVKATTPSSESAQPSAEASSAKGPEVQPAPTSLAPSTSEPSASVPGSATVAAVSVPSDERMMGDVEVRPSYVSQAGSFHTENHAELGYQFSKNAALSYRQQFDSNLFTPNADKGVNLNAGDGFVRGQLGNLWDNGSGLSLSYEGRAYLPTHRGRRDSGMVTAVRNYLLLSQEVSSLYVFTLAEVPIVHIYNQAGPAGFVVPGVTGNPISGAEAALPNPVFENRVYLINTFRLTENLRLDVPVWLLSTRFANQGTSSFANAWGHVVMIYPEISYRVMPNASLGLAYASDNLVKPDFSDTRVSQGLEQGVTQLVLRASL